MKKRETLQNLPESAIRTYGEARLLSSYRQTLEQLHTQHRVLERINSQIATLSEKQTPQNGKQLHALQAKAEQLRTKIAAYEAALQQTESSDVVQEIANRMQTEMGNDTVYFTTEGGAALQLESIPVPRGKTGEKFRRIREPHAIDINVIATNPGYKKGGMAYRQNCQRCVPTYEMRRRGYDVIAKPAVVTEDGKLSPQDPLYSSWKEIFAGARFELCTGKNAGKEAIIRKMKAWGDGAVAEIRVSWDRVHSHVFVAEQTDGKVRFVDPQNGDIDCEHYFTKAINGVTMIARIDNLETTELIELCVKNRGGE